MDNIKSQKITFNVTKCIVKIDKKRNNHPKNRLFIFLFRYGQYFFNSKKLLFKIISIFFRAAIKCLINRYNHIPLEAQIGEGVRFPHMIGIVISGDSKIGSNATIMHQVTIGSNVTGDGLSPNIGNNVFIGTGAKVIGGCSIGDNVKIGANAVVTKNIPNNSTVIGYNKILKQTQGD